MLLLQFIIIQTIIFGGVIFLLKKIMVGSTESAVTRLNESYEEMEKKTEELAVKIKQAEDEYRTKKAEAEEVTRKMLDEADETITQRKDEILKKARDDAERLISDTVKATDAMRDEIKKEERLLMTDYCLRLLENMYEDTMLDEMDRILLADFIKKFDGMDGKQIPGSVNEVNIVTRKEMTDDIRDILKKAINQKLNREMTINEDVDKQILGGIILKFGSLVLDGSVSGKLSDSSTIVKEKIEKIEE